MQLSDTHVGYEGAANPDASNTLPRAVEIIRSSRARPDFVVFTGDLTQSTEDDADRRARMKRFKEIVSPIDAPMHFIPGEHDASSDVGVAFRENFGETHWTFEHEASTSAASTTSRSPAPRSATRRSRGSIRS